MQNNGLSRINNRLVIILVISSIIPLCFVANAGDLYLCDWGSCSSSNVDLVSAYLGDSDGAPIAGCIDCGEITGQLYLWVTIHNGASNRYQGYLLYTIDGIHYQTCLDMALIVGSLTSLEGLIPGGDTTYRLIGLDCGGYTLNDVVITWLQNEAGAKDCPGDKTSCTCPDPSCDQSRNGAQCEYIQSFKVSSPPDCDFTSDEPVCVGDGIAFDGPGGMDIYTWDFGDGSDEVHVEDPTHVYSTAGVYTVTLTVTKGSCPSKTCTDEVTVIPVPIATIEVLQP